MIHDLELVLVPGSEADLEILKKAAAKKLRVPASRVGGLRVKKRSLDARKKPVVFRVQVEVAVDEILPADPDPPLCIPALSAEAETVVIVGCGPAGMFAALRCLELGLKPVILERGKDASARRFDLAPIMREGRVVEDSNYCFGEGGAGTFSDGKLYTRATKRGPVHDIYRILVQHGAPKEIMVEAHPHIGSNLLPKVVMALRETIKSAGGEVRFGQKVTGFLRDEKGTLRGVSTATGEEVAGRAVILATGHSARDIYELLHREKFRLEAKAFALGVRIEHAQPVIDRLQYHLRPDQSRPHELPASRYRLACQIDKRSVHSFCMCPGGFVVPAATENDEVVVNGMSLSRRDSPFANSGLVVGLEAVDFGGTSEDPLAGVRFQKKIEQLAKQAGGGGQVAPAQRAADFLARRASKDLPETSYFPGLKAARLDQLLPAPIARRLALGLKKFARRMENYAGPEALLIGFETRTSSPVRVPRDESTLQHPELPGLFPCGEGAGYAGGIVSAALDGRKCAEAVGIATSSG